MPDEKPAPGTIVISQVFPSPERLAELQRRRAYLAQGCDSETLLIALWEKVMEDRGEAADSLQAKRLSVKAEISKL